MTTIYLIRHAQAEGNLYRRFHGQYNSALTTMGQKQLVPLAERFASVPLAAIYSSDLRRAQQTANAVAKPHGLTVWLDPRLREINVGEWDDLPVGAVEQFYPQELWTMEHDPKNWVIPGAEVWDEFYGRFYAALTEYAQRHDGKEIALVTHSMLLNRCIGQMFPGSIKGYCDNTAVTCLEYEGGTFRLRYAIDSSHVPQALSTYHSQRFIREHPEEHYQFWYRSALREPERYIQFRREAWELVYGDLRGFDGPGFWSTTVKTTEGDPDALVYAMSGNRIAGILQLNVNGYAALNAGYIPFIYLREEYRHKGLGVQLIGYAIQYFRKKGRTKLQLSVAPTNAPAIRFYEKLDFYRIAVTGGRNKLWVMEKEIG